MHEYVYLDFVRNFAEGWDGNKKEVQMYPFDTWDHPMYGVTTITPEIAAALKASFDNQVKGTKLFADYEHGLDKAKGSKSAGQILSLEVKDNGLWGVVNFTDTAKAEIDAGEWNYWSTSHWDEWTHPHTNQTHKFVFNGGALTNSPWVKGMEPLNFNEIFVETIKVPKEFADWTTAYKNALPDSAFLYIAPGGSKDSEGKTTPRSLRHFPVKDATGKIDMEHVRKVLQLAPKAHVPDNVKAHVEARAKRMLGAKNMAEAAAVLDEVAPEEMHDYGLPPDPSINADDGADTGSRIPTPPFVPDAPDPLIENSSNVDDEGGLMPTEAEVLAGIRTALGLGEDADVVQHITDMNAELEPLRELKKDSEQRKEFSENYPKEFERLQQLEVESRERYAREFSEKLGAKRFAKPTGDVDENGDAKLEVTTLGLSALAIEEIGGIAKKFSDRTASLDDFSGVMNTLLNGGIVDYGEKGSTQGDPGDENDDNDVVPSNFQDARKMFSDKVNEIVEKDEVEFNVALKLAAERHPELYAAYQKPPVVG